MGDALKHAIQADAEENAKEAYIESVITYLVLPTNQNKTNLLSKMSEYNILNKGNIFGDLKAEFEKLELNDHYYWKEFNVWAEKQLFYRRPELREKFITAAKQRNIGSYKWTL